MSHASNIRTGDSPAPSAVAIVGPPRVSVIIPAYYSSRTIAACLAALRAQTFRDFETVVINSSPETRTAQIVTTGFPEVVFEQRPARLLPQAARNRGVELAKGELLVFTDPDCRARPDWLERLVRASDAGHEATGGSMGLAHSGWFAWGVHLSKCSSLLRGAPAGSCAVVCTANAAYSRRAFDRIGPFQADICISDVVLSWDAHAAGLNPWFDPRASVDRWHDHSFRYYLREFFHRGMELVIARSDLDRWSRTRTSARAALFPALAAVEVWRVGRRAFAAGCGTRFLATWPAVAAYRLAWSAGEAAACIELLHHPASRAVRLRALHL